MMKIEGDCATTFDEVAKTFEGHFANGNRGGAAVCVYHHGKKVVDLWGGERNPEGDPWKSDTLAMSMSTTKGVASTALHMCVGRGLIDYDDPVAQYWPEFASNGKETITVRQVMCHEAGLHRLGDVVDDASKMLDWDAMVRAIEEMKPAYEPGTANGYHAVSYGWLVGELIRRVSGLPIEEFVVSEIAEPLELDGLYIGLPDDQLPRLAKLVFSFEMGPLGEGSLVDPEMLQKIATGMQSTFPGAGGAVFFNQDPPPVSVPIPAANGCFTARSLAKMYAALAMGGQIDGVRLLPEETIERAIKQQNSRPDLVVGFPMLWRLGYHAVWTSAGPLPRGFGHFGFGGSGAWADPDRELAVALTINRLSALTMGDLRLIELSGAAVRAADAT